MLNGTLPPLVSIGIGFPSSKISHRIVGSEVVVVRLKVIAPVVALSQVGVISVVISIGKPIPGISFTLTLLCLIQPEPSLT